MPRVDFYILSDGTGREHFSCDLAAKINKQKLSLHIQSESRDAACQIDDLLWTFRDISFLPHSLADAEDALSSEICIGWPGLTTADKDVFINLDNAIPQNAENFQRVVEIVPADEPYKTQARERYKQYREKGYELHNHDMR